MRRCQRQIQKERLTILRRPSAALAALSLDSEFGLRERVITACTLTPELAAEMATVRLVVFVDASVDEGGVTALEPAGAGDA